MAGSNDHPDHRLSKSAYVRVQGRNHDVIAGRLGRDGDLLSLKSGRIHFGPFSAAATVCPGLAGA